MTLYLSFAIMKQGPHFSPKLDTIIIFQSFRSILEINTSDVSFSLTLEGVSGQFETTLWFL